jgi:2-polyprenyl-3-methyl-5-hydroxy-6-metoxy-1,4-benzoquinol methylase
MARAGIVRLERTRMANLAERLGHEDTPRVYTDRNVLVRELFWRRLDALLGLSRPPDRGRVLDFGGGNGVLLPTLSRLYRSAVCVDLRTEMAEEVARADALANVEVRAGELSALALPGASFDTIVAADVLEHIVALDALAAEFRRLLVPGGELLVSAPSENRFYELGRRGFGYTKPEDHYHDVPFVRRRYFPFNVRPLAVFSLARFVKPPAGDAP